MLFRSRVFSGTTYRTLRVTFTTAFAGTDYQVIPAPTTVIDKTAAYIEVEVVHNTKAAFVIFEGAA